MSTIWELAGNRDELRYLFEGGYLALKDKNKTILVHNMNFYTTNNGEPRGAFTMYSGKVPVADKRLGVTFNISPFSPSLGLLNGVMSVVYTSRAAVRQYVRVLNSNTLKTAVLYEKSLLKLGFGTKAEKDIALPQMLGAEYPTVDEAMESVLRGDTIARAFTPKFFVANSHRSNNIVLGYKTKEIGEWNEKTTTINLYDEFEDKAEEVSTFFNI